MACIFVIPIKNMIQVGHYTVILNPYVPDLALPLDLKTFFKNIYGPFLWMWFNCLKATEPLQGSKVSSQKSLVLI